MKKNQYITTDVERICVVQGELGQFVIGVEFILVVEAFWGIAATAVAEEPEVQKTTEEQEVEVEIGEEWKIHIEVQLDIHVGIWVDRLQSKQKEVEV